VGIFVTTRRGCVIPLPSAPLIKKKTRQQKETILGQPGGPKGRCMRGDTIDSLKTTIGDKFLKEKT